MIVTPRTVVVSWSGGIDSTALIAQLLHHHHRVHIVTYTIYGGDFGARERAARMKLLSVFASFDNGRKNILTQREIPGDFLWSFSGDQIEIPYRNKRIIDHLVASVCPLYNTHDIALGEYTGADTWLVRDHVGAQDADTRALSAYLYNEYGIDYQLWTLDNFGHARYKHQRAAMLYERLHADAFKTTNCLLDVPIDCGYCYKCVERHAAFMEGVGFDQTRYVANPEDSPRYELYLKQMREQNPGQPPHEAYSNMPQQAVRKDVVIGVDQGEPDAVRIGPLSLIEINQRRGQMTGNFD